MPRFSKRRLERAFIDLNGRYQPSILHSHCLIGKLGRLQPCGHGRALKEVDQDEDLWKACDEGLGKLPHQDAVGLHDQIAVLAKPPDGIKLALIIGMVTGIPAEVSGCLIDIDQPIPEEQSLIGLGQIGVEIDASESLIDDENIVPRLEGIENASIEQPEKRVGRNDVLAVPDERLKVMELLALDGLRVLEVCSSGQLSW